MNADFKAFVEEVRLKADIVAVVGSNVDLKPAGGTFKGLSPFHGESHPAGQADVHLQRRRGSGAASRS
ncbi:MAG: CHC2 zinc finger domain-containing protein [Myxococcota bacterium]|jgi:DNA primase|nr:CHC2 zinc finger domain-containing protein [Myxococcota bacterium]